MGKVFGYPKFDEKGEMILTTYDNEYKAMMMDIRVYQMSQGETRNFSGRGRRQRFFFCPARSPMAGMERRRP